MAIQAQLYSEHLAFPSGGSQDWMDNGCGFNEFCLNLQQKQQQQQQQQQQQYMQQQQLQNLQHTNQNLFFGSSLMGSSLKNNNNNNNNNNSNSHLPMVFFQSMTSQVEKQRQEIDLFISLQNERLRLLLQEQRKQELAVLLKKIESKTLLLLKRKEEEIARAAKRSMELEDFLRKLEMENQAWQRVAKENEATVVSLNNTLEQLRENACCGSFNNGAEDAESCCDENREENRGDCCGQEDEENRAGKMMVCKSCNSRSSCVLFLPCRHLCSCKACEAFLDSCPVCRMGKKASIEALFF